LQLNRKCCTCGETEGKGAAAGQNEGRGVAADQSAVSVKKVKEKKG
jgi:hypothetical protein